MTTSSQIAFANFSLPHGFPSAWHDEARGRIGACPSPLVRPFAFHPRISKKCPADTQRGTSWATPKGTSERGYWWSISMLESVGNTARTFRGDFSAKTSSLRQVKHGNTDWLKQHAQKLSAKEGSDLTGLTSKAFENLRTGRNKINFDNLVEWCRNDPQFAAAFAEHVGLVLPGEAEFAGALTHAVNAYLRRKSVGAATP